MKRNRIMSLVLAVGMIASCSCFEVSADSANPVMKVEAGTVIKTAGAEMYGISTDWSVNSTLIKQPVATDTAAIDTTPNPRLVKGLNEYTLPLVRLGEEASRTFKWKSAIGPMEGREEQTLWGVTGKVSAGPLETVNTYETIDSNAAFSVTLNVENDTAQNAADFAQFLTGGTDTVWGKKRADYGRSNPVNVTLFELGNEVDHGDNTMTVNDYIAKCKEFIAAVKTVAPNAKFAVQASTGAYGGAKYTMDNGTNGERWRNWHKAILADSALASQIDYIALHTYFYAEEAGRVMDNCVRLTKEDIKAAGYGNSIKTFISEYAMWNKTYANTAANTHNIAAVTETSDVISRMMQQPGVEMMTYHGINSGDWANVVNDTANDRMYLNGIGSLLKLYKTYGTGDVLKTTLDGFETEKDSDLSGVAVRNSNGNISYIFTNKSNAEKTVTVDNGTDTYKIKSEMRIKSKNGQNTADLTASTNNIDINTYTYSDGAAFTEYTIPAYSVCAVETYNADKTAEISESFTYEENFDSVADGKLPAGWRISNGKTLAGVENRELVVEPSGDWTTAIVRIPDTENTVRDGLTLEADMTLVSYNTTTRTGGARNKAGFAYMLDGSKTSSCGQLAFDFYADVAESGASTISPRTDAKFKDNETVKLKLVFEGNSSPNVYINGSQYAWAGSKDSAIINTTQNTGGIGIMVNDAKAKFDNIKISGTRVKRIKVSGADAIDASFKSDMTYKSEDEVKANIKVTVTDVDGKVYDVTDRSEITAATENGVCTVTVKYDDKVVKTLTANILQQTERGFRFEENFNSIPNGQLPSGMKFIGTGSAEVKDGALYINGKKGEWGSNVLLLDVDSVSRYGLEMECDITRTASGTVDTNNEQVGFIYANELVDGKLASGKFSKVAAYTSKKRPDKKQQLSVADGSITSDSANKMNEGGRLDEGGTVNLRMVFTKSKKLFVYVNGEQWVYSDKECSAIESGYVGIYVFRDTSVKIDNLVISGTETVYPDTESKITKVSSNAANGTVSVSVNANSAGLSDKSADIIAAVYEKESGRLISVSGRKAWNIETYPSYRTSLDISGINDYSADKYTVKVFALDGAGTLKPLVNNIEF